MTVLVVNAGSSSVKFRLFAIEGTGAPGGGETMGAGRVPLDPVPGTALAEGLVERIGSVDARFRYLVGGVARRDDTFDVPDHEAALGNILRALLDRESGVLATRGDVAVVGHRVVHGADKFQAPTLITREVKAQVEACVRFAPLHNPVNLAGLAACEKLFPAAAQVAVFDTAFHATMPREAYLYPLPYILYERHAIRRYGFHGTSHKYVAARCRDIAAREGFASSKVIVCHLGNGSSVCAVKDGKSVDTSMGFTPLEGLMMGTRSGDLDPGVLLGLLGLEGLSPAEVDRIVNKYSGFRGVTEDTSDVRTVLEKAAGGYERHALALAMFCYRIKKYVGAYAAALGGVDVLAFTGGIGENAGAVRKAVCEDLGFLGLGIDDALNGARGVGERFLSPGTSRAKVLVVPTNEEWQIAAEALEVMGREARASSDARAALSLSPERRLALVRAWNEAGGVEEETLSAFASATGVKLSRTALAAELATVGIRI